MFGLFGKKKKTVVQTLEELDKEIKEFEKYKQKNELNERKYIGALVLYSIVLYITGAIIYYIYLMPKNVVDRVKTLIPFLITPLLIYAIRRFLKWYFIKRSTHYERKLFDLKEEKKKILEDVKENETYKKAREILERFSANIDITPPETPVRGAGPGGANNTTLNPTSPYLNQSIMPGNPRMPNPPIPVNTLTQRNVPNNNRQNSNSQLNLTKSGLDTTFQQQQQQKQTQNGPARMDNSIIAGPNQTIIQKETVIVAPPSALAAAQNAHARTLLPRPIINPNRTYFDKLLDFIVGEGPNNRYALICKNCHFHNGMALKEEFEYVAFRCAYCLFYNEARKTKLSVPKLSNSSYSSSSQNGSAQTHTDEQLSKPRRQSKPNELLKAESTTRSESAGVGRRGGGGGEERASESLHSTLSSSASLDDLATCSEPIISNGVHKRGGDIVAGGKTGDRAISIPKETSGEEEKKNI